jgi:hypothetical protein
MQCNLHKWTEIIFQFSIFQAEKENNAAFPKAINSVKIHDIEKNTWIYFSSKDGLKKNSFVGKTRWWMTSRGCRCLLTSIWEKKFGLLWKKNNFLRRIETNLTTLKLSCSSWVARFFLTQYTKTGKNIPNYYNIT